MANEGPVQEAKDTGRVQLEKVAEEIRRIQPGWFRLAFGLCSSILLICFSWWAYYHSDHNPAHMGFFGFGCAYLGLFSSDLRMRFRLQALLYDLVWHG